MLASRIAEVVGGTLHGPDVSVEGASFDSRTVRPGELFVPIVADRDGHDFVDAALAAGAAAYLTSRASEPTIGATAIAVDDTAASLMTLAAWARRQLDVPVVAVTGSVGKTSTKDLVAAALGATRRVTANVRSFNNEQGLPVTILGAPDGVELWLVESMNPDGQAAGDRHNAHHVDLNRNFPYNWGPIGQPGVGQYAGPGPASEPETLAVINLIRQLRPDITIWYHQDLFTISPSTGRDGRIRARYSELTGVPLGEITGGIYTGVAATWARRELEPDDGVAFIVELGATLTAADAELHATAVRTIAAEG